MADTVGFDEDTLSLIYAIERVTHGHDPGRVRQALASALWRSLNQHPSLSTPLDLDLDSVVLRDGGRRLALELVVLPIADCTVRR